MTAAAAPASGRYELGLAASGDDEQIRDLLRRNAMGGSVRLTFEREPSYEAAAALQGEFRQTIVGRLDGRLVGMGARCVGRGFVNGREAPVGYLSDLKLDARHRGGTLIARGYRLLRRLHEDGRCAFYATVIVEGNAGALSTIAAGRAGLPRYRDLGRLLTPLLACARARAPRPPTGVRLVAGRPGLLPAVLACLNRFNARRQLAPAHSGGGFAPGGRWIGVAPEDFTVALRGGEVCGALAIWDQRAFKQARVAGYSRALSALRPLVNAVAAAAGLPRLPKPGRTLAHAYAAFPCADGDDPAVFSALLDAALARARAAGLAGLTAGLHERDPLAGSLARRRSVPFAGRLFAVSWEDGEAAVSSLDGRPPYLEAGAL